MTLIYRGHPYTRSNHAERVNPQTTLTYRGQSYQRRYSRVTVRPNGKLMYRGVPYVQGESSDLRSLNPIFN